MNGVDILMYADDTIIYSENDDPNVVKDKTQCCMNNVYKWCQTNKLTFNCMKTKQYACSKNKINGYGEQVNARCINIDGELLSSVQSYKYLGIDLDNKLVFEEMIDCTFKKANRKLYTLKRIRPYISTTVAKSRGDVKISHSRMKHAGKHWEPVCEMYVTSHKRPFVPSQHAQNHLTNVYAVLQSRATQTFIDQ